MKVTTFVFLTIILALSSGCSSNFKLYTPKSPLPRAAYVGDQVQQISSKGKISESNYLYTEIRTLDGDKFSGKLIEIHDDTVVLSEGFYYTTKKESAVRIEKPAEIKKEDILILKIW